MTTIAEMVVASPNFAGYKNPDMGKRGPQPFKPTEQERQDVIAMIGGGIPQEAIRRYLHRARPDGGPISENTFRKAFRAEIASGGGDANGKMAVTLFAKALGGDTTALIWWTKTRMGWRELIRHDVDVDLRARVYRPDTDDTSLG